MKNAGDDDVADNHDSTSVNDYIFDGDKRVDEVRFISENIIDIFMLAWWNISKSTILIQFPSLFWNYFMTDTKDWKKIIHILFCFFLTLESSVLIF